MSLFPKKAVFLPEAQDVTHTYMYECMYVCMSHLLEFLAHGLYLKSHQRCSPVIRTCLSADQSSSFTLTESSFLSDPCLIHVTVLLVCPGWPPDVSVCWAHGLLFVWCHVLPCRLSVPLPSCYLIIVSVAPAVSPSLPSFVSLYSSPCVCSLVLIRCLSCVHVMWVKCLTVLQSSACLLVFPLRGGFCSFV